LAFFAACGQKTEPSISSTPSAQSTNTNGTPTGQETLGIDPKELAKCAAIENQVQRVSCFDVLANKYGQAPTTVNTTSGSKGRWQTSTETDPLTDKSVHRARVEAHEGRGKYGDAISLHVRCKSGKTEAYVNWSTFLGSDDIAVTSRIDKSPAEKSNWSISTDHKASFMPKPLQTLKKFSGATTFVVNLTPYGENPVTAIFDISGAEEALKDIKQACSWNLASTSAPAPIPATTAFSAGTASSSMKTSIGGSCKYLGDCEGTAICENNLCIAR
jgi:type VI secretion system protein VasI